MLKLQFNDNRQAPIWLADPRFTLGQNDKNSLVLPDEGVSAFHAEIRQEHGHYYLSDCGSQTGTFVNGERINSRFQVRANDHLRLGSVELQVVDPNKVTPRQVVPFPRWSLQVLKGEQEGKKFPVTGSLTFGRSVKCDLCFGDLELSRRHCEFFLNGDSLEIKDLGSANGVYVNRERLGSAILKAGDQLQMGAVRLLVIGPKVEVPEEQDEDATVFMPAVVLPTRSKSAPTMGATARVVTATVPGVAQPVNKAAREDLASIRADSASVSDDRSNLPLLGILLAVAIIAASILWLTGSPL
ncbi:MAG: FHA domain-containing protein [Pseudomonadota bacterium]